MGLEGQMQEGAKYQRGCYFRKGGEGKPSLSRALNVLIRHMEKHSREKEQHEHKLRQECVCP